MVMPLEIMLKGVEMLNSANLTISIVGNLTLLHVMSKHVQKNIIESISFEIKSRHSFDYLLSLLPLIAQNFLTLRNILK